MSQARPRRKILGIDCPRYAIDEFKALQAEFDVHYFIPVDREQVIANVARLCREEGPFDAGYDLFGTSAYSPLDSTLLGPLFTTPGKFGHWAHCGAGYDDVTVDWFTENGCYVSNTPAAVTESTADMAIFLMLAVLRNTTQAELNARQGRWRDGLDATTDPNGIRLGIIGMGAIGSYIAKKARVFGMEVVYNNRKRVSEEDEKAAGASYVDFDELIRSSDVISVSCPLTPATRHLLSTREFDKMKDGVFIVNTARGAVIDEPALIEALESGKVARAGLDVFEGEPTICDYLRQSLKVTVQPHVGASTKGTIQKAEQEICANLKRYFADGKPVSPVNTLEA